MSTKKKPAINFDLDMTPEAAEEAFLSGTPDKKPKRVREKNPDWKCCTIWLPNAVFDVLTEDAQRSQYVKVPNFSLYLRQMVIKEANEIKARKAKLGA